jgi:hypothetical protein
LLCDGLANEDRGEQIAINDRPHVFQLDANGIVWIRFSSGRCDISTGVVDQNVNRSQLRCHFQCHSTNIFFLRQVSQDTTSGSGVCFANLDCGIGERRAFAVFRRPVLPHAVDSDAAPKTREAFRERTPQTASGSRNKSDFAFEHTIRHLFISAKNVVVCHA